MPERLSELRVQAVDDRARRAGRRRRPEPLHGFVSRQARLLDRRHIGQRRRALARSDGEHLELAGPDVRQRRRQADQPERYLTADEIADQLPAAAVGHVLDVEPARLLLEELARKVLRRRRARRAKGELAWLAPRQLDQLL